MASLIDQANEIRRAILNLDTSIMHQNPIQETMANQSANLINMIDNLLKDLQS